MTFLWTASTGSWFWYRVAFISPSFLSVLRPREGYGRREWRSRPAFSSRPRPDGRRKDVVAQERLGGCQICKRLVSPLFWRWLSQCFNLFTLLTFVLEQVLEAHGLKPISLKPKEVHFFAVNMFISFCWFFWLFCGSETCPWPISGIVCEHHWRSKNKASLE